MPSGFTRKVQDGEITEFKDFVLICARAFSPLISMREDPLDAEIPEEIHPLSTYHVEGFERAAKELAEVRQMSISDCEANAQAEYDRALEERTKAITKRKTFNDRYEEMLEKAKAWEPPTPDHQGLKDFMISQLEDSIKWDCSTDYWPEPTLLTGEEWALRRIEILEDNIAYHSKHHKEDLDAAEQANNWVKQLRSSLDVCEAKT